MRRRLSICKPMIPVSMLEERPMLMPSTLTSVKSKTLFLNQQYALSNPVLTKTADEINFMMNTQPNLKGVISEVIPVEEEPAQEAPEEPVQEEAPEEPVEEEPVQEAPEEPVEETYITLSQFSEEDTDFFKRFLISNSVLKNELVDIYRDTYQIFTKKQREEMELPTLTSLRAKSSTKEDILFAMELAGITTEMVYETFINNKKPLPEDVAGKITRYFG